MVPRLNNASTSNIPQKQTLSSLGQQLRSISRKNQTLINAIENRMNDRVVHEYKYSVNYDIPNENDTRLPWTFEARPVTKPVRSLIDTWEYSGRDVFHRAVFDGAIEYTLIKYADLVRLNNDLAELGTKYVEYFADREGTRVQLQYIISNLDMIQDAISEVHDMTVDIEEDSVGETIQQNMKNVTDALENLSACMPELKVSLSGERYVGSEPSNSTDDDNNRDYDSVLKKVPISAAAVVVEEDVNNKPASPPLPARQNAMGSKGGGFKSSVASTLLGRQCTAAEDEELLALLRVVASTSSDSRFQDNGNVDNAASSNGMNDGTVANDNDVSRVAVKASSTPPWKKGKKKGKRKKVKKKVAIVRSLKKTKPKKADGKI